MNIVTVNTIIYCRQWDSTVAFYRELLALPVTAELEWFVEFELNAGARLSVADESRTSIRSSSGKGLTLTFRVEDLPAVRERLVAAGLQPTPIHEHAWGAQVMYLHDPEGTRLEYWME